ncbi:MAG: hypothetical protein ACK5MT_13015 [Actinomycetales bacterium]
MSASRTLTRASIGAWSSLMTIAGSAPVVIGLRLSQLAQGGASAASQRELDRMVTEKISAVYESTAVVGALVTGMVTNPATWLNPVTAERSLARTMQAADQALKPFARRVEGNAKRLSRR